MTKHLARIAVTILFFFFGGISASWASRIPTIKDFFGVNDSAWGFVLLYISIGTLISLPFAGKIIEKTGSKKATLIFLLSYFILLIGIGYFGVLWQLKINLVLFGAISNITNIAINTQAVQISKKYKGQIIGSLHGTWSIGGFMASWLGAEMISSYVPPLNHFIYFSALGMVFSLIFFRYLLPPETNIHNSLKDEKKAKAFQIPDKNLLMLGLLAFFALVAEGTMTDWANEYMKHVANAPVELIGYGLTAYMFTMASGRFISDFTVRKFGEKNTLFVCGILLFIGLISAVILPGIYSTIFAFMIVGLGVSAVVPMTYNLAGQHKTIPTQQAITFVTSIGFIGFFLGPPIIGFIAQESSLKTAFGIIAFFGLAITMLSKFLKTGSNIDK